MINGSVLPSDQLCRLIKQMDFNEAFLQEEELIVAKLDEKQFNKLINDEDISEIKGMDVEDTEFIKINHLWDLFRYNDRAIKDDFRLLTKGRTSHSLSSTNILINPENIFVEQGAEVEGATLNALLRSDLHMRKC